MPFNAPYSGGSSPGAQLFAVDGDFTIFEPSDLPEITYPFRGDSVFVNNDWLITYPDNPNYLLVPLGTYPNIHPWSANQVAAVLEQDFMVAESAFIPIRLNTPYYAPWSIGWQGQFEDGSPTFSLDEMYLVENGQLYDEGAGIVRVRLKFATLPPSRSEIEQYAFTFPGVDNSASTPPQIVTQPSKTRNVLSRLQYDYFIMDDLDLLSGIALFPNGPRLNASTGLYPIGLILPAFTIYDPSGGFVVGPAGFSGTQLTPDVQLTDPDPMSLEGGTEPSATAYINSLTGNTTSNGLPAEIVAESSTMTRWMGNIWERRTRFVLAQ